MAERTERLGGQLAILARPPRGTRVECRIPYPGVPEEA
jgi:signal transduction histidine kinase